MGYPHKEVNRYISPDLEDLVLGFGGFSPMALSDAVATSEEIDRVYRMMAEQREAAKRAKQLEMARTSARQSYIDECGTTWEYVVLDGTDVRIVDVETTQKSLVIPEEIDGKPVTSLGSESLAATVSAEEIICAPSIYDIGLRSFLDCKNLRRLVLPRECTALSSQWYRGSVNVEELVLPGLLAKIEAPMFDFPHLKRLVIGEGLSEIAPGTFEKLRLDTVEVSPENPYMKSDGMALYSLDGSALLAMAKHVTHYDIAPGCRAIAKKAFYSMESLESIGLPDSLEVLGDFCFGRTSLTSMDVPPSVTSIGEKAFFYCAQLERVTMHEGLREVKDEAFSHSHISEVVLPSTIEHIGKDVALDTRVVYAGPDATFRVSPDSPTLLMDEQGGLYRREEDGLHFMRLMDPGCQRYKVMEGAICIDSGSFTNHAKIQAVALPNGLTRIEEGAFRNCRRLEECLVPPTLETVGPEAFLDTVLTSFTIPAGLKKLGDMALTTKGAHSGIRPTLKNITVQPGNERYFVTGGMLCERFASGRCRIIVFDGSSSEVTIPPETYTVGAYAFSGIDCIRYLRLSNAVEIIEMCGLKVQGMIEHLRIDLKTPYQGHDHFDIRFPRTDRGAREMQLALCVADHVDIPGIYMHYDNCISNTYNQGFVVDSTRKIDWYDQTARVLERLRDPVYMTASNKMVFDNFLNNNIEDVCVSVARRDDRESFDTLFDLGYLNEDNLLGVIDQVGRLQDAAMTGYLLEKKKKLFTTDFLDFDL